ncbi:Rv3235 family protein [Nocardioides sp.]|uniref:Rv3235 family protein n=1 Tax=Nocardioides sp. TaxID=35761 RepID=UPI002720826B|nr:Rv3235 family protein [Nocardioides sp.]MDO9456129.1 Rv3235 family protein [Nocardioides sp.]
MSTRTPTPLFHENVVPLRLSMPVAATQGTLALDLQPRLDPPSPPAGDLRRRREVDGWAHRFVQAVVEIVGGDRPTSQLVRHTSRDVYADLERRAQLVARVGGHVPGVARVQPVRPRVVSVHSSFVTADVAETSAHVRYGQRSRAVAARFERRSTRWVCTAVEFA